MTGFFQMEAGRLARLDGQDARCPANIPEIFIL
jgi:hypothetical protein